MSSNKLYNVAILIPICSKNQKYKHIQDIPLLKTFYPAFLKTKCTRINYTIFLGYNDDDDFYIEHYSNLKHITKHIYALPNCNNAPAFAWNKLADLAHKDSIYYDYFFQIGDDVVLKNKGWTSTFINKLNSKDNLGIIGPIHLENYLGRKQEDRPEVIENAFFHRTHLNIFGYVFYPKIKNWYCDDWITSIYKPWYAETDHSIECINQVKGSRYQISDVPELKKYIKEGIEKIYQYIGNKLYVFSFCIYGNKKKYTLGMIKNLEQINEYFPSYHTYIYVGNDVDTTYINQYETFKNVNVIRCNETGPILMSYRFFPIDDKNVYILISRDSDSRFYDRDRWVINDFLESDKNICTIRDHIGHQRVMMGGLSCIKKFQFLDVKQKIQLFCSNHKTIQYQSDQDFIEQYIYHPYKSEFISYSNYITYHNESNKRIGMLYKNSYEFCGNVIEFRDDNTEYTCFEVIKSWWLYDCYRLLTYYRLYDNKHKNIKYIYELSNNIKKSLTKVDGITPNDIRQVIDFKIEYEMTILAFYNGIKNINNMFINIFNNCNEKYYLNNLLNNYTFYCTYIDPKLESSRDFSMNHLNIYNSSSMSLIPFQNGYIANQRFVNYTYNKHSCQIVKKSKSFSTLNRCIVMNDDFDIISSKFFETPIDNDVINGIEDIRLYHYNHQLLFNGTSYKNHHISIGTGKYDIESNRLVNDKFLISPFGNNVEKNWVYVTNSENSLCMIYKWFPIMIGKPNLNSLEIINEIKSPNLFKYVRGSSNAVEIDNEIWFLCHIVSPDKTYYHLFVILNQSCTRITRYTLPFKFTKHKIEYCIGFCSKRSKIVLSYSVWDNSTYIISINRDTLDWINN